MKTYQEFINEDLKLVSDNTNSSIVYTGSKYDILKKSNSRNKKYTDLEFEVHEMMKKRSDLFCRILKNSKEQVLMEKLDIIKFNEFIEKTKNNLEYNFGNIFFNSIKSVKDIEKIINCEEYFSTYNNLQKKFLYLKLEICKYFEDFIKNNKKLAKFDLHSFNFGFIKGTEEIRCFDPIVIYK